MKKLNKKNIAVIALATIATVGITGSIVATSVEARMLNGEYSPIVEKLAEKFGVSEESVQSIFEESRAERINDHLQEAVNDGLITENQMELIISKKEIFRNDMEKLMDEELTRDEYLEKRQTLRNKYSDWAEENGIDISLLRPHDRGNHMGDKMHH